MIANIEKYATLKGISMQDAMQTFMQVIALKNIQLKGTALIGGAALVIGHNNPRFSEDIDLTGVTDPLLLESYLQKAAKDMEGFLSAKVIIKPPKAGKSTWQISCATEGGAKISLHVDSQGYPPLSHAPLMVEYPGIMPFVFPSVDLAEIMADKLIALAFRKYASGRDIFDLWYHWFSKENAEALCGAVLDYVAKKLKVRSLNKTGLKSAIHARLGEGITKRVKYEWDRYLPSGLKNEALYEQIFETTKKYLSGLKL